MIWTFQAMDGHSCDRFFLQIIKPTTDSNCSSAFVQLISIETCLHSISVGCVPRNVHLFTHKHMKLYDLYIATVDMFISSMNLNWYELESWRIVYSRFSIFEHHIDDVACMCPSVRWLDVCMSVLSNCTAGSH